MATGTPFHPRTSELCHSLNWRQWSGFFAASSYEDFHQPEYAAIRHAAALIDVSPLYKYLVSGRDARLLIDRTITQNAEAMEVGQVVYTPWCDPDGKVRQEGTVFRLEENAYLVCAAEPTLGWLRRNAVGMDVRLGDRSFELAALSLQGPSSRQVLRATSTAPVDDLKFFRCTEGEIAGVPVKVSRTGYTGDLGYEIWIPAERALTVWDALLEGGRPFHVTPCGLLAMDIARVEAGFILINVDYVSSEAALIRDHVYSPYELGLGWTVKLDKKRPFVGRDALAREKAAGSPRRVVGLEIDWQPLEDLFAEADLMPGLPLVACREPVPVYDPGGRQVGRATTRVWSTLLKKYIALATVDSSFAGPGSQVAMEITVNHCRRRAPARVVKTPFYRPERTRA